jgi:hypothetical protein
MRESSFRQMLPRRLHLSGEAKRHSLNVTENALT